MQTGPEGTAPAKADSEDQVQERVHMVQQTGDALAWRLGVPPPGIPGTPQSMHEESQGSISKTPNYYRDVPGSTKERKGHASSLRPSGRNIWEWPLVGSQRSRQAKWPPTSPQSTRQVCAECTAYMPQGSNNEQVGAHTGTGDLRLHTATFRSDDKMQEAANCRSCTKMFRSAYRYVKQSRQNTVTAGHLNASAGRPQAINQWWGPLNCRTNP